FELVLEEDGDIPLLWSNDKKLVDRFAAVANGAYNISYHRGKADALDDLLKTCNAAYLNVDFANAVLELIDAAIFSNVDRSKIDAVVKLIKRTNSVSSASQCPTSSESSTAPKT